MIYLEKADVSAEEEVMDFRAEVLTVNSRISGGAGLEQAEDYGKWLKREYAPHYGIVEETVYLARNEEGRIVGIADLRIGTNDFIRNFAGQIGYTVRPSERRKGYASGILKAVVREADHLGMTDVLVTCNENNEASSGVIEKAGGVLENIIPHPGFPNVKRYRFLRRPSAQNTDASMV